MKISGVAKPIISTIQKEFQLTKITCPNKRISPPYKKNFNFVSIFAYPKKFSRNKKEFQLKCNKKISKNKKELKISKKYAIIQY